MADILIIDDSATMRQLVVTTLESAGHRVFQAADGAEGLRIVRDTPLDLVITDLNMPRVDGLTVVSRMRSNPRSKKIPIYILSTENSYHIRRQAKKCGASGWITKPFSPASLLRSVRL